MQEVLSWIDPAASAWLARVEQVTRLQAQRPVPRRDVVVVAADQAWPFYLAEHAYICQSGRTFQPVQRMAFYAGREIKPEVPLIMHRVDNVEWTESHARRLLASDVEAERDLGRVIRAGRASLWQDGRYQAFLLTAPGSAGHLTLPRPVAHTATGRGSAFTQRQRYVSSDALRAASTTKDLSTEDS